MTESPSEKQRSSLGATSGGRVDNEIDAEGRVFLNGEETDGPSVTDQTKFIVLGRIPQPAELSDPDDIQFSLRIAQQYSAIATQARERGVRIVSLVDFLRYIGYEPVTAQGLELRPKE